MQRVLILGAGGHAQQIADILLSAQEAGSNYYPIGYLDDDPAIQGQRILDLPVLGQFNDRSHIAHDAMIVGIGNNQIRRRLYEQLREEGDCCATACHPSATIARGAVIGQGTVISAGCVISTGAVLGENVIINTSATIGHHSRIGNHVHIGPGVHTGGNVQVGVGTFVGVGGIVMPQRCIGNDSVVGAGALVHSNVPDRVVVVGVPARVLKHLDGTDT